MPDASTTERCLSCRRPIFWATTDKGRAMPLDLEPHHEGNVVIRPTENGLGASVLNPRQADGARRAGQSTYRAHFVRCPSADMYRGRGK